MSIDFTGVTAVQIPEGNVTKITRKSDGSVLWEKPVSGELPSGYTALEYIKFTGEQAVDTGIIPDYNTKIEVDFMRESTNSLYMYGVLSTNNTASVTAYLSTTSGSWRFGATRKRLGITADVRHTATQDNTGIVCDGTSYTYESSLSDFTSPNALAIGSAKNVSGGYEDTYFVGRIYAFSMHSGDTLVAEYRPCRNPDGECGFWDKVTGAFKASITETALDGA